VEEHGVKDDELARIPLFSGLSKAERRAVAQLADEIAVEAGVRLVREGEYGYEVFAIEDGRVEVTHQGRCLADLGPGDFFGELAVMSLLPRNASVVATSPVRAIVMTRQAFRQVAKTMPRVAEMLRATIEQRSRSIAS
jgi:voltage-gated potassium channel